MIQFNEVTWYSKLAAVVFFLGILPVLIFYIGMRYQEERDQAAKWDAAFSVETPLAPDEKGDAGDIRYVTQSINGFDVPQVVDFPNAAVMGKVNAQISEMANGFGCDPELSAMPGASENSYDANVEVSYAADEVFSVSVHASWYCGGPYPTNDSNQSVTFDMRTGEPVALADLFDNYERDRKKIAAIIFAQQIEKYAGPRDDQSCNGLYSLDCEGDCLDFSEYLAFEIEGNGITAQPIFPHVIEACSEEGHASAESLAAFFGQSSVLARVQNGEASTLTTNGSAPVFETYRDERRGFSIAYPAGTKVLEADPSAVEFRPPSTEGYLTVAVWPAGSSCYDTAVGSDPWIAALNGTAFVVWNLDKSLSANSVRPVSARESCAELDGATYRITRILPYTGEPLDVEKDAALNEMLSSFWVPPIGA